MTRRFGIEHYVVDDELAATFKGVLHLHSLPRQFATFTTQLITEPSEFLLLGEVLLSGL